MRTQGLFSSNPRVKRLLRFVMAWLSLAALSVCAQPADVERQVKAAYLYKFGSYVEWPDKAFPASDSPLRIGIMGSPQLADELSQLAAGRSVNNHPIAVQKLKPGDSLAGINILYVAGSANDRLAEILAAARGQPILTVTEANEGLGLGSVINFVLVEGKLRFEVAPKTASQGNLVVSARLLAAAYKVGAL